MSDITLRELYDFYLGTFQWCSSNIRALPDEELLCNLFEEFDVEARSFLHEINLDKLRAAGLIDDEDVELSKEIRMRWLALESRSWTPEQIRCNPEWDELFNLCDSLRLKLRSSGCA